MQQQDSLKSNLKEAKNLLDCLPCSIVMIAENYNIVCYNQAFIDLSTTMHLAKEILIKKLSSLPKSRTQFSFQLNDCTFSVHSSKKDFQGEPFYFYTISDNTSTKKSMDELYIYKEFMNSASDLGFMISDVDHTTLLYHLPQSIHSDDDTSPEMVVGKKYEEVFPNPESSNMLTTLRTGKELLNKKNVYTTPSGKTIVAFGSSYPIKKEGKTIAACTMLHWNTQLTPLLNDILEYQNQISVENTNKNNTYYTFSSIIGESPSMKETIKLAQKAASFNLVPILICGETGTGKEMIAQSIHNASANASQPFIAVNVAAIPENLLEITLFGSVPGAFTEAKNTKGLIEQAGQGTLFLDEINSMPGNLQAKLLRAIQEKTYRKLGDTKEHKVGCRIMSSINQQPQECISNHTLREDLYYRISALTINVPPLRERKEDIIPLAEYFLEKFSSAYEIPCICLSPKNHETLMSYSWPGNVRELQNTMLHSLLILDSDNISFRLPELHAQNNENSTPLFPEQDSIQAYSQQCNDGNLKDTLTAIEESLISNALQKYRWNITKAAESLGLSRSNLQYKIKKFDLIPPE